MSIVFMDGFDHYGNNDVAMKWDSGSTTITSRGTGVYGVGQCLVGTASNRTITKTLTSQATWIICFHVNFTGLPGSDTAFLTLRDGATSHVDLRITAAGAIRATRNGTSLGISSSGIISTGTWYWLCAKFTIDDSAGVVEVHLNNSSVLSLTSQDTRNGANASANNFQVTTPAAGAQVDNLVVLNTAGSSLNDIPTEEWRISTQTATGAGNSTQWTPSAGSNYQNVDDATSIDSDSTYNSSSTAGHTDLFAIGNFDSGVVRAVQTCITARKDDGGTREIREKCRSGSTNYSGATQAISSSYLTYRELREVDPATAAAWTLSNLDAAEFGYELVT